MSLQPDLAVAGTAGPVMIYCEWSGRISQ